MNDFKVTLFSPKIHQILSNQHATTLSFLLQQIFPFIQLFKENNFKLILKKDYSIYLTNFTNQIILKMNLNPIMEFLFNLFLNNSLQNSLQNNLQNNLEMKMEYILFLIYFFLENIYEYYYLKKNQTLHINQLVTNIYLFYKKYLFNSLQNFENYENNFVKNFVKVEPLEFFKNFINFYFYENDFLQNFLFEIVKNCSNNFIDFKNFKNIQIVKSFGKLEESTSLQNIYFLQNCKNLNTNIKNLEILNKMKNILILNELTNLQLIKKYKNNFIIFIKTENNLKKDILQFCNQNNIFIFQLNENYFTKHSNFLQFINFQTFTKLIPINSLKFTKFTKNNTCDIFIENKHLPNFTTIIIKNKTNELLEYYEFSIKSFIYQLLKYHNTNFNNFIVIKNLKDLEFELSLLKKRENMPYIPTNFSNILPKHLTNTDSNTTESNKTIGEALPCCILEDFIQIALEMILSLLKMDFIIQINK
ncbi:hypothetical protein ABK040_002996 [Willaertia magna]